MESRYLLDYAHIAERVRDARRRQRLTQAELAEQIGLSTNAVAKLETGLMTPSLPTLVSLANALQLDMNELFSARADGEPESGLDLYLGSLLRGLSVQDKEFLVRTIDALAQYKKTAETE